MLAVLGVEVGFERTASASSPSVQLYSSYKVKYVNTSFSIPAVGQLIDVRQSDTGAFTGMLIVDSPLGGTGPCTGQVSGTSVTMSVKTTGWHLTGTISSKGVIAGNYTITGQMGLWTATPVGPPPSTPPGKSNRTSTVATSLSTPRQAFHSVARTVLNAILVSGGVLFITFPAQIFNDTLDENYEEILAMWRRFLWRLGGKRRMAKRQRQIPTEASNALSKKREIITFAAVLVVGSVIGGYRDPSFGVNLASVANLFGTIVALAALVAAPFGAATLYRHTRHQPVEFVLRAIPAGLAIAVLSVVASRWTHFEPGYLYGLVCGVAFAHRLKEAEEGHTVALESLAILIISALSWLAFVPVDHQALRPGSGFGVALLDDLLASVVVGGIVGVAIGLLPLRFLPGGILFKWSRTVWAMLMGIALFGIVAIMLNPSSAPVNNGSAPIVTIIVLFVVFGGASVVFRQFFASRRSSDDTESRVTAPTGVGRLR
jgi:hypothetical protein